MARALCATTLGRDGGVLYIHFGLDGLITVAAGVGVIWLVVCVLLRTPLWRGATQSMLAGYLAALLAVTLIERSYGSVGLDSWRSVNLIPMGTVFELSRPEHVHQAVRQLLGNVAMFIPFGVLLPSVAGRFRRFPAIVVAAVLASVAIEIAQLSFSLAGISGRSVDIDDVILNVVGATVGFVIWSFGASLIRQRTSRSLLVRVDQE